MEAKSGLKVVVNGAGTQLLQMREEEDGDLELNLEDKETSDPDLCSINAQLRQMELDWSRLLADVPVTQQALHKVRKFPTSIPIM